MYDRFTDRARKVMQLANQEAHRLNHEYIGTEHILLGLVKEGSGVAAHFLKSLDANLHTLRSEVEKLVQKGPDMATMGRLPPTPRATKVIAYSAEEAASLSHNYVGTEHLLLGLLREQEGLAAQVLMNLGFRLKRIREEFLMNLDFRLERTGEEGVRLLGAPPNAGSVGRQAGEHPGRRLGRWVRRHELALIFLGGVLAPLIGAAVTALARSLPEPGAGGMIAGLLYLTAVAASCILSRTVRSTKDVRGKGPGAPCR